MYNIISENQYKVKYIILRLYEKKMCMCKACDKKIWKSIIET